MRCSPASEKLHISSLVWYMLHTAVSCPGCNASTCSQRKSPVQQLTAKRTFKKTPPGCRRANASRAISSGLGRGEFRHANKGIADPVSGRIPGTNQC